MTRDEQLREIQRRIAEARGWTDFSDDFGNLIGVLNGEERGVPRWPQSWHDSGELVKEMEEAGLWIRIEVYADPRMVECWACPILAGGPAVRGEGASPDAITEAIARCWCAWKGIDLADLTPIAEEATC